MTSGMIIVSEATSLIGKIPYHLGASVGNTAKHLYADCSSFVQMIFSEQGVNLPRTADQQYKATMTGSKLGINVPLTSLKAGDLVFMGGWNTPENKPGYAGVQHVAIYAGNGMVVGEGGGNDNVNLTKLSAFGSHVMYATRVNAVADTTGGSSTTTTTPSTGSGDNLVNNQLIANMNPLTLLGNVAGGAGDAITGPIATAIAALAAPFLFMVVVLVGIAFIGVGGMMVTKTSGGDVVKTAATVGAAV